MAVTIQVSPRAVFRLLLGAIVLLVVAAAPALILRHGFGHDYARGLVPLLDSLFDLNAENTPAAWFSSFLLLLCAALLALIGIATRAARDRYARRWLALGAIFAYLSLDETATLHERQSPQ